ncbi:uncharacterized protein LOC125570206 [Nematostella vectensis]|uniref:uncharacterized protein LOC125570206 n=1 Tax=Nematostella vectensis TaxID=45351 RepID=UPI0020772FA3|nr:uncharacterized protein LOC125570206 [Nematostella vectensis]
MRRVKSLSELGSVKMDEAIFSTPASRKNEDLILLEDGRDVSSLNKSALQSELHRLGMKTSGNKPALTDRLKQAILKSRQKTTIAADLPSSSSSSSTTQVKPVDYIDLEDNSTCSCQLIVANLKSQFDEIKENNKLRAHLSSIQSEISYAKEENKILTQERDSLIFALQIVSREASQANQCHSTNNTCSEPTIVSNQDKPTPQEQWSTANTNKKSKKKKNKRSSIEVENSKSEPEPPLVKVLDTSSETGVNKQKSIPVVCAIVGDSIVKRIQGTEVGKKVGHRVIVKGIPGATISDMEHYVKPTLERNPTRIIIHVGTNDLRSLSPVQADGIVDLAREIESTSTGTKVVISELVTRRDSFRDGVQEVNKRLKRFCSQNRWDRISHTNITTGMLNQGGLHLNASGNDALFNNFVDYLSNA